MTKRTWQTKPLTLAAPLIHFLIKTAFSASVSQSTNSTLITALQICLLVMCIASLRISHPCLVFFLILHSMIFFIDRNKHCKITWNDFYKATELHSCRWRQQCIFWHAGGLSILYKGLDLKDNESWIDCLIRSDNLHCF